jgi:hypothetical protein
MRSRIENINVAMSSPLNFFARLPNRIADVVTGRSFEEVADHIINSAHSGSSRHEITARIETEHSKCFAYEIRQYIADRDKQLAEERRAWLKAERIEKDIWTGAIPEHAPGTKTFHLPSSFWPQLGFFLLLAVGLSLAVIEGLNVAWFFRFKEDSFRSAILYSIPIFAFPAIESVILGFLRPRLRKSVMFIQGIVATGALATYVYYSILSADNSLTFSLSEASETVSTDRLRMLFQVLTSVLFSTICLSGAHSMGIRKASANPQYLKAVNELEVERKNALEHKEAAEHCMGSIERIDARKDAKILRWHQKFSELQAVESTRAKSIRQILSE